METGRGTRRHRWEGGGAAVVAGWTRTRAPHGPTGSLRHVPPGPRRHPRPIAGRGSRSRTLTRHATRGIGNVDHIAHGTRDRVSSPKKTRSTLAAVIARLRDARDALAQLPQQRPGLSLQHRASRPRRTTRTATPPHLRGDAPPPVPPSFVVSREPSSRAREEDERRDVTLGSLRDLAPADVRGDGAVPVVPARATGGPSIPRSRRRGLGQRGGGGGGEGLEGTHRLASCSVASASIASSLRGSSSEARRPRARAADAS